MELNIVTPSSQVAFLGNQVPMTRQQMLSRPLLNTSSAQASSQLYGAYLGLLARYMPSYAFNAWANPGYGLNNQYFALPVSSSYMQAYGAQQYYRPTYVTPTYRF